MSDPTSNEAPEDTPDDPGDVSGQVPDSPEATSASGRVVHLPFPGVDNDYGLSPRPRVRARRVDPLLGLDLGGVVITRLIGEGGMGRVYEAHQANPARTVAVKVVRQGITTDQIAALSSTQANAFTTSQIGLMSSDQLTALIIASNA